jgi:hypothetical protein
LPPNSFDITYEQDGPLGAFNPDTIRAAGDGSHLNFVQLSSGDLSVFTLDANHPYSTSGAIVSGNVSELAVLNGVTSTMAVEAGTGPTTAVTFIYDIRSTIPEPSTLSMLLLVGALGLGPVIRKRRTSR